MPANVFDPCCDFAQVGIGVDHREVLFQATQESRFGTRIRKIARGGTFDRLHDFNRF